MKTHSVLVSNLKFSLSVFVICLMCLCTSALALFGTDTPESESLNQPTSQTSQRSLGERVFEIEALRRQVLSFLDPRALLKACPISQDIWKTASSIRFQNELKIKPLIGNWKLVKLRIERAGAKAENLPEYSLNSDGTVGSVRKVPNLTFEIDKKDAVMRLSFPSTVLDLRRISDESGESIENLQIEYSGHGFKVLDTGEAVAEKGDATFHLKVGFPQKTFDQLMFIANKKPQFSSEAFKQRYERAIGYGIDPSETILGLINSKIEYSFIDKHLVLKKSTHFGSILQRFQTWVFEKNDE